MDVGLMRSAWPICNDELFSSEMVFPFCFGQFKDVHYSIATLHSACHLLVVHVAEARSGPVATGGVEAGNGGFILA